MTEHNKNNNTEEVIGGSVEGRLSEVERVLNDLMSSMLEQRYVISSLMWSIDFLIEHLGENGTIQDPDKFKKDHNDMVVEQSKVYYRHFLKEMGVEGKEADFALAQMMEESAKKREELEKNKEE